MFSSIRLLAFDVDGVLTDGSILVLENGLQARRMSIRDGYALHLAVKKGFPVLVISGAESEPVRERLAKLGVTRVFMGVKDKWSLLSQQLRDLNIASASVLYMGDDIPDLEVMQQVGLAACPADAAPEIKAIAAFHSEYRGGEGCVRDVIERVLKAHGFWDTDVFTPSH